MDYSSVLLILIIIILSYIYISQHGPARGNNLVKIKSKVTNDYYYVNSGYDDLQQAADTMANIEIRLHLLLRYLKQHEPTHPITQLIMYRFDPDKKKENSPLNSDGTTSYTLNKGEMIYYCIRYKDTLRIHKLNDLMFVAIHELAHVGCKERNHPPVFWKTFKWLLDKAIKANAYELVDYRKQPFKYCGMNVAYQPYLDPML